MFHDVFILIPLFGLGASIGLIGSGWSVYILTLSMPLLLYVPDLLHYLKYKNIKDDTFKKLIHSRWFMPLARKEILLGIVAGVIMNISLLMGNRLLAALVFLIAIIISFKYTLDASYEDGNG